MVSIKLPKELENIKFVKDHYNKLMNIKFNTTEQFIMSSKAILFNDDNIFFHIINEKNRKY